MQQIFVRDEDIQDGRIRVTGEDAAHLGRSLRLRAGETLRVSTDSEKNYLCETESFEKDALILRILGETADTEPGNRIVLFQAIPKGTRLETVIEKSVELGVSKIVPVEMKYCVVHLDEKKKKNRRDRWQKIAEQAAKQSKRSRIPEISGVVTFSEAVKEMGSLDISLVPYENAQGVSHTAEVLERIFPGQSVGILIGPEGGFAPEEIREAEAEGEIVSLGRRILRTDTAAITAVSLVMMASEEAMEKKNGSISR